MRDGACCGGATRTSEQREAFLCVGSIPGPPGVGATPGEAPAVAPSAVGNTAAVRNVYTTSGPGQTLHTKPLLEQTSLAHGTADFACVH